MDNSGPDGRGLGEHDGQFSRVGRHQLAQPDDTEHAVVVVKAIIIIIITIIISELGRKISE